MGIYAAVLALALATLALTDRAHAQSRMSQTTVGDLTRIKGQGESILQGLGLVMGLPGTGDSGKELVVARPLAKVLENNGNAIESLKELEKGKAAALVMVTCVVPASGVRADDKLDVTISVINSATSLKGGTLYVTPLTDPRPGGAVYAVAQGKIELEDAQAPTRGKVREGARIVRDILMEPVEDKFELILDTPYAGWAAAEAIASAARSTSPGDGVAQVVDDRTVLVTIPVHERKQRATFIADVLKARVETWDLGLPAQVVCNPHTGVIVVTGDVEISPGMISHKDLVITSTVPAPVPTKFDPLVERSRFAELQTNARPAERSKLSDLMAAFKQLDIPPSQQIEVLQLLHKSGRLHAKLVVE